MSPLLRRLRPTLDQPDPAPEAEVETRVIEEPAEAEPDPEAAPKEPEPLPPAGFAPEDLVGERPDTRRRSKLRRRLRHLRQIRELMLRDVGGLVYEIHRAPGDERTGDLVPMKLERLAALDLERRELEALLGDERRLTVLREPGVGGACPNCGEYFGSDAHFCSRCGTQVAGTPRPAPAPAEAQAPA